MVKFKMNKQKRTNKGFRIPAFWQAVLVVAGAWLIFETAVPPLLPQSLMVQYMIITIIGVLLFFSFDEQRWTEFKVPVLALLRDDNKTIPRALLLVAVPGIIGYVTYNVVKPSLDAPVELRQAHPAPPSNIKAYGKNYNLSTLENPLREEILADIKADPETGWETYRRTIKAGRDTYYRNCFYCHGDLLDGRGHFANGFDPLPANFQDVGTIAQLQEAFLFWRIATGGPGLPAEGTPWNSAMPVWHEMLEEEDTWQVIMFLYDYVGQVPRIWDQETSRQVTNMKDQIKRRRSRMMGDDLYQFRCAVCHGEQGRGDGIAAEFLYPGPRDFSLGLYKYKTSPGQLPPRNADLFNAIKYGLQSTGMPGWKSLLSDKQIRSLIPVIKRFDITATWAPLDAPAEAFNDEGQYTGPNLVLVEEKEPLDERIPYSEESVTKGRSVFESVCAECHGEKGRGNITSGKRLTDDWGDRIWPRDLTQPWTWRVSNEQGDGPEARDNTIERIYERLSIGIPGTPMPAHRAVEAENKDPIATEDRWHVANYVYSLRENATAPEGGAMLRARYIEDTLPDSPDAEAWQDATAVTLPLVPNIIKDPRLFKALSETVTVKTLYNADEIAFLLEIDDRTDSRPGEPVTEDIQDQNLQLHPDAFAIQFPRQDSYLQAPIVEKPLYRHGETSRPTTIWYWNAGAIEPETPARAVLFDASGPDKKLVPRDDDPSLKAVGNWEHGRWQVVMKRPRFPDNEDVRFEEGRFIPISFANWDGSNGENASRHTLTTWYWLVLPPPVAVGRVYGIPAGVAVGIFLLGLLLVRDQRRKAQSVRVST